MRASGRDKGFSQSERRSAKLAATRAGIREAFQHTGTLNAYERHRDLLRNYYRFYGGGKEPTSGALEAKISPDQRTLTDAEALRRQHRFVRDEEEDKKAEQARGLSGSDVDPKAWEIRMASKYYKLLFKEYALVDLSRYREGQAGMRWRTEKEVVSGKGQFECGSLRCMERRDLHSYETNFRYKEAGETKNELVKVRVCPQCARKLFFKKLEALRVRQEQERERERRRRKKARGHREGEGEGGGGREGKGEIRGEAQIPMLVKEGVRKEGEEEEEGHDLVLKAVETANAKHGGGGGGEGGVQGKKRKSRWGCVGAGGSGSDPGSTTLNYTDQGGQEGPGGSGGEGGKATRSMWEGEVQKDRTVEDDMDDYLSSLLF
ncbi:unnamed protein product [Discosporangium mesarthrocarpum]